MVLSGTRIGEGGGVERCKMLGEAEGIWVWEGGSEGVLGMLEALVGSVREVGHIMSSSLWVGRERSAKGGGDDNVIPIHSLLCALGTG